ncbi:MAG: hydrogen gas-evolving membrane-bound hydrogenase subunit E [Thermoplasmatota archaeon]
MKTEIYKKIATFISIVLFVSLLIFTLQMDYSDKEHSSLNDFYRENADSTGATNLVEAIILDFRAYDTFGEVMVLYIAIAGVIILSKRLGSDGERGGEKA